jgi:hypothetical protein
MLRFFIKLALLFVIYLAVQRFIFLFLFSHKWNFSFAAVKPVVIAGARFDMMCFGYMALPCLVFLFFQMLVGNSATKPFTFLNRFYLAFIALVLGGVGFIDLLWFSQYGDRINSAHTLKELWAAHDINTFFCLAAVFSALWALRFALSLKKVKLPSLSNTGFLSWIFTAVFLAILIRGSFGDYHLDLRDSQVTTSPFLNVACVPSPYALDQAWRGRR